MAAVQVAGDGHDKVRMCFVIPMSTFFAGAAERGSSLASFVERCSSLLLKPHRISAFPSFLLEPRKADGIFTEHF